MKLNVLVYFFIILLFFSIFIFYLQRYYYHYDDAFITYTFARNLADGYGIVFHPSFPPIQGSSTLLYTFILAFLHKLLQIEVDKIGLFLSIISFSLINLIFVKILNHIYPNVNQLMRVIFFITLFSFQVSLYFSLGLEIIFLNLILLLFLYTLLIRNNHVLASIILVLVPLTRLDYAFFIPAISIIYFIKIKSLKKTFYFLIPVIISIVMYLVFSLIYFGEFFPHSWLAKSYLPASVSGIIRLKNYVINPAYILFFGLGIFSIIYIVSFNRKYNIHDHLFLSFIIFIIEYILYLLILEYYGAPDMPWYVVTLFYYLQYTIWYFAYYLLMKKKFLIFILIISLAEIGSFLSINDYSKKMYIRIDENKYASKLWHNDRREKAALFLRDSIPDIHDKKILLYEAGKIPYFTQAKCYDILGLVSRESFDGLRNGKTEITLSKVKPDIIVGTNNYKYFPMSFLKSVEFQSNYTTIKVIDGYFIWRRK